MNTGAFTSESSTAGREFISGSGPSAVVNDRSFFLRGARDRTKYYYDSSGRRRRKDYPDFGHEEFFYDGTRLLEDRGRSYSDNGVTYASLDEYIWLGDRPVAYIKSRFNATSSSSWVREPDLSGNCKREGQSAPCGVYYPITDYLPKTVALLNWQLKVVGAYDYDPFGHVNRVSHVAETPHPYPLNMNTVVAHFRQPPGGGKSVELRPRFALRDIACGSDSAFMTKIDGSSMLLTGICGWRDSPRTTPWVSVPEDGVVQLRFKSDNRGDYGAAGLMVEGYEYRRFESYKRPDGSWLEAVDFPLRFPGQYYDAETDLFENWNRFYDASNGRYLAPDPVLRERVLVVASAVQGKPLSTYAYAVNNPIVNTDSSGLLVDGSIQATALAACLGGGNQCRGNELAVTEANLQAGIEEVAAATPGIVGEIVLDEITGDPATAEAAEPKRPPAEQAAGGTPPTLPDRTIVKEDGVRVSHNYGGQYPGTGAQVEHGPAHADVEGKGPETHIGPKGYPLKGQPPLTKEQRRVVEANRKEIRKAINKIGRWLKRIL